VRLPILDDGALHRISVLRARALDRLLRARPAVVFSDPAGLHWLAGQEARPQPALLLTSAQHFSTRQREELARAVPAPVINYYACADAGPLAWECLAHPGRLHALLPDAWLESVGGEIAVTRLRPGVMPLLRYRTGDRGDVVRDDCACGYRGWSVVGFAGRRECAFLRPDGRRADAWQLVWLFKHYPLAAFRLTQTGREDFELELVGDGADLADLERRLRASLALLGWSDARITVRAVPALEARGGKPEPFRCALAA
jgi:phenylacetate-CoA ligase